MIKLFFLLAILTQISFGQSTELVQGKHRVEAMLNSNCLRVSKMQLNQSIYSSGDTILFSAFLNHFDSKKVTGKKVIKVRIINEDNTIASINQVAVNSDVVSGGIALGGNVKSGWCRFELLHENVLLGARDFLIDAGQPIEKSRCYFLPEAGAWINGLQTKVLVYTGLPESIVNIVRSDGSVVFYNRTDSNGFSQFNVKPVLGDELFLEGSFKRVPIPQPEIDGVSISLTDSNLATSSLVLRTSLNSKLRQLKFYGYLIVDNAIVDYDVYSFGKADSITLPVSKKPNTIFVLLDSNLKCISVYQLPNKNTKAQISFNELNFKTRKDVEVQLHVARGDSPFTVGKASATIVQKDASLLNWKGLDQISDETNRVESSINWQNWFNASQTNVKFLDHIQYSGTALFSDTNQPVPDSTILFAYLQKHLIGYETATKQHGRFRLSFYYDFYGNDSIFLTASYKGKFLNNVKIDWDNEVLPKEKGVLINLNAPLNCTYFVHKTNLALIQNSYRFFGLDKNLKNAVKNPNYSFEEEFLGADVSVNVRDYVAFPTMVDLVREIVPNLIHRVSKGKEILRVVFSDNTIKPTDDPLYIINGKMTKSTSYFLSLKASDVISIKVAKDIFKLSGLGQIGRNGIVYVQTREVKHAIDPVNFPYYKVSGFSDIQFSKRSVLQQSGRNPAFEPSVYWASQVDIKNNTANLKFQLTDYVGPIIIKIDGVTEDGDAFTEQREVNVVFK
jgi:hypothetical protein